MISVRWYTDILGHYWPPLTSLIFEGNISHFPTKVRLRIVYRIFLLMISAIYLISTSTLRSSELVCCLKSHWVQYSYLSTEDIGVGFGNTFQNKFQKRANFQTWWSSSTMSVTSEKPRMLTIYRSNQSTESDQKAILLNLLPNESNTLYHILLTDS